jgi:hypothetical protein
MNIPLASPPQDIDGLLIRVRAEYDEMPGLRVTKAQAERLWGLDNARCAAVLAALVKADFLAHTEADAYVRAS